MKANVALLELDDQQQSMCVGWCAHDVPPMGASMEESKEKKGEEAYYLDLVLELVFFFPLLPLLFREKEAWV